ncbi:DoxX family protein [Patescibacteria group bacterium]|nr:DoxX family protein [Patescibacteria group bacterium]
MNCEKNCCSKTNRLDIALLVLRIAAGVIFVLHGYGKLFGGAPGMTGFTGMVANMGFPLPIVFAYAAALSEFVGGLALIFGLFTNVFSVLLSIVMIVAFTGAKHLKLPMGDVDLALLSIAIAIYLVGPGMYTVRKFMKSKTAETCECKDDGACCKN